MGDGAQAGLFKYILKITDFLHLLSLLLPALRDTQQVSLVSPFSVASPVSLLWIPRSYGSISPPSMSLLTHCVSWQLFWAITALNLVLRDFYPSLSLDICIQISQFRREPHEGRSRASFSRDPCTGHTSEKQSPMGVWPNDAGELHPVTRMQLVDCVNCVPSRIKFLKSLCFLQNGVKAL